MEIKQYLNYTYKAHHKNTIKKYLFVVLQFIFKFVMTFLVFTYYC